MGALGEQLVVLLLIELFDDLGHLMFRSSFSKERFAGLRRPPGLGCTDFYALLAEPKLRRAGL
jgi:hypothetical protein